MSKHGSVAVLYSGGLDSYIAYHYAIAKELAPIPIHIDLGHPYAKKELQAIQTLGIEPMYIDLKTIWEPLAPILTNQIIPSRNLLFATIGGMFAPKVWIAALEGEQNGLEHDKSERFFTDTSKLLTFLNEFFRPETKVESPFASVSKKEIIAWALNFGIAASDLLRTSSCYNAKEKPCGECLTCVKRYMAFRLNGITETCETNPLKSNYFASLCTEIPKAKKLNDHSRFTSKRVDEFYAFCALVGIKL